MEEQISNNEIKEEEEFFTAIKMAIDHEVDEKILNLTKLNQPFDKKKIKEQCEKRFFSNVQHEWEKEAEQLVPFFQLLQQDHPHLLEKLQGFTPSSKEDFTESIKKCKHLADFNKLSPASQFTAEDLKELYNAGKKCFKEEAFDKALAYFLFLVSCDSKNPENWIAKGMAEQNMEKYDDALLSYATVLNLVPEYALCYLQIIECLIHKKQFDAAKQCYSAFMENTRPEEYSQDTFLITKVKSIESFLNVSS